MSNRTCKTCGWVHFAISRADAEKHIDDFNAYFDSLSPEEQMKYYGGKRSNLANYDRCDRCGTPYTDFRASEPGDCPAGCTVGPILDPDDTEAP